VSVVVLATCLGVGVLSATAGATSSQDQALADELVLAADDVPHGWNTTEPRADEQDFTAWQKITACRPFVAVVQDMNQIPHAKSPIFYYGASTLENTVYVYPTVSAAKKTMHNYAGPRLARCFQRLFQDRHDERLAHDTWLRNVEGVQSYKEAVKTARDPGLKHEWVGFDATFAITFRDGRTVPQGIHTSYLAIRVGRTITDFNMNTNTDSARDTVTQLVVNSVGRVSSK
jgi:hypothetical protein